MEIPIQTASGRDESYAQELDGAWQFGGRLLSASAALNADRSNWQSVTIPHTWNAVDADDGGGNYDRTVYWYHKEFTVTQEMQGKRIYLEFLGVNTKADVYVNGQRAGDTHKGGYTTFRYDVTDLVQTGTNTLDVQVDNRVDQSIAPISGDFNIYGGIYKRVYLLTVEDVHVDLEDYGSSGLYLTTGNMRSQTRPEDLGQFNIRAGLVNDSEEEKTVTVTATVTGDNAPAPITREITIPAGETVTFDEDCTVENPAYASSEEGTATDGSSTTAASAVDGDGSTRWTAFINNGPDGEEDAYYPEWLCVDLGGRVQLNRIDLALESKGGRTYDYNVYVSTTTAPPSGRGEIPDGFTLLYSRTNNTESGQQSTISTSAVARYVLVEITGCSAYSSATPYVGASIYELEVYGTPTLRSVTVESTSGGTAGADASSAPGGTLVTLTATPDQGYYLKEWRVLSGTVTIQNNRFIMPDEDVVIQAVFEEGLSDANIPGDVNRDGIVDVLDVMTLAQIVVGKTSPAEGVSQEVMDLNGDHSVNVLDVMCLAQIAAGRLS